MNADGGEVEYWRSVPSNTNQTLLEGVVKTGERVRTYIHTHPRSIFLLRIQEVVSYTRENQILKKILTLAISVCILSIEGLIWGGFVF